MIDGLTPGTSDKIEALLRFAKKEGIDAHVVSTRRSCAEQDAIYESGPGTVTQARGCVSWHVWGRAADLVVSGTDADYGILGDEWKRMGGVWGGDFSFHDLGHFEWHPGITIGMICQSDADCPDPNAPWADDRPLLSRPLVQATLGLVLAGASVGLAQRILKR